AKCAKVHGGWLHGPVAGSKGHAHGTRTPQRTVRSPSMRDCSRRTPNPFPRKGERQVSNRYSARFCPRSSWRVATKRSSQMIYQTIDYNVVDNILTLTLNRPDRLNAFTLQMMDELID